MRIRSQFALALCGMVGLSFALGGYEGYRHSKDLQANMINRLGRHYAKVLALAAQQGFVREDLEIPIVYLYALRQDPEVADAYLVGPKGWMVLAPNAATRRSKAKDYGGSRTANPLLFAETVRTKQGRPIGSVRVEMAKNAYFSVFKEANQTRLPRTILLGLLELACALAVALLIAFLISRPIRRLLQGVHELGTGNLDVQVPERGASELGELAGQFNEMARKLRSLDELKDEWISKVSHDVRSPMGAVKMYADYMLHEDPKRDKLLPEHRDMLAIIEDNALRLNIFVSNLLDAAKMKAGRMEFHPQPVAIDAVFRNVKTLYEMVARQRKVDLVLELPAGPLSVLADPEPFDRVIFNLLSNALKFTNAGGRVTLGAKPDGDGVEIFIADTGKGISKEMQAHLFERFYQADAAGQKALKVQGTGLGLFIVKQTVEGMGGRVRVESEPGRGTRFTMRLAAHRERAHGQA